MAETRVLIEGGLVYDHDGDCDRPAALDILIEGARIARVGPGLRATLAGGEAPDRVIDARRRLVVPGFVNAHYHSHDVLLKGVFDPMPLQMWFVNALPPQYPIRSAEEVRARTLLGAAECLLAGITTVQDMLTLYPFDDALLDAVLEAYDEIGIRTVFSLQIGDRRAVDRIPHWRELVPEEYHSCLGSPIGVAGGESPLDTVARQIDRVGLERERFSWALGPTSAIMSSPELLAGIAELSDRHDLPVLTHMYESRPEVVASRTHLAAHGGSQIEYMRAAGLLGPRLALAHSIWFAEDEIAALAEAGGRVVLNPASNMKSKSGVAPIQSYRKAGVEIALGCDNCACSDVQNMFQSMKLFCGLAAIGDTGPRYAGRARGDARGDAGRRGGGRAGRGSRGRLARHAGRSLPLRSRPAHPSAPQQRRPPDGLYRDRLGARHGDGGGPGRGRRRPAGVDRRRRVARLRRGGHRRPSRGPERGRGPVRDHPALSRRSLAQELGHRHRHGPLCR